MSRAFVFPGQGSQAVGMGCALAAAFPVAAHLFEEVDEALKQKLSTLMFEGPADTLTLTENAQPALMAVSLAVLTVLEREGGLSLPAACTLVAGHSLGEYSALAATRAIPVATTARLLRTRGRAMQKAVPVGEGAMAALMGLDLDAVRDIAAAAAEDEVCAAANDNAPGQVVVSGHRAAVERAIAIGEQRGARRAILLPVSAPFHCALMAPAAEVMAAALEAVTIAPPAVPIVTNVSARPEDDPARIRDLLVAQVTATVRWREDVLAMKAAGVETLVELGAGRVLSGLARRIDRDLTGVPVGTPDEIESFLKSA